MRILGVFIIGFTIILIGFNITNKYLERNKQLRKICFMISQIKQKIKYKKLTVKDILNTILLDKEFSFLNVNTYDYDEFCFNNKKLLLNNVEKKTLYDYFSGLGKSDLNGQLTHCDLFLSVFEEYLIKFNAENNSKIKLFPTLFILLGLLIIIILV